MQRREAPLSSTCLSGLRWTRRSGAAATLGGRWACCCLKYTRRESCQQSRSVKLCRGSWKLQTTAGMPDIWLCLAELISPREASSRLTSLKKIKTQPASVPMAHVLCLISDNNPSHTYTSSPTSSICQPPVSPTIPVPSPFLTTPTLCLFFCPPLFDSLN